ncbi:MAG: hypothetical protein ACI3Y4_02625 [Candidatus Cryptobacteroides sp.]
MKYILRSIKYFVYLAIMLAIFIAALLALGFIEGPIDNIFKNGADSLWQMALIVAAFAAVYPMLGYGKRNVRIYGEPEQVWPEIVDFMNGRGYILAEGDGRGAKFRLASKLKRILRMGEDTITFTRTIGGYTLEGRTKEIVRLDTGLTQKFEPKD